MGIKSNIDLILPLSFGFLSLLLCVVTLYDTHSPLLYLRWIVGIAFLFFLTGYPITTILYPGSLSMGERIMLSSGIGLFLTYPAGLINVIVEGKVYAFHPHLIGVVAVLNSFVIVSCFLSFLLRRKKNISFVWKVKIEPRRIVLLLLIVLAVSAFFNFYNLSRADLNGDEWALAKYSYDLVDANFAARKAYVISFHLHAPLGYYISHATMQMIFPLGLFRVEEWMIRFAGSLSGVIGVGFIFLLARKMFNENIGILSSFIVAISNYTVWSNRLFVPHDTFLMFFMILSVYFFSRFVETGGRRDMQVAGFFLGCTMLTKFSGISLIPLFVMFSLIRKKKIDLPTLKILAIGLLIFTPVILFNIGAYLTTGYMDVPFSKMFGTKSPMGPHIRGYMGGYFSLDTLEKIFVILLDQYSPPLFILFLLSFIMATFLLFREGGTNILLLWIWAVGIFLSFWLIGVRSYYLPFITFPLAILTGKVIYDILSGPKERRCVFLTIILVLSLVLLHSAFYTYSTNISSEEKSGGWEEHARIWHGDFSLDFFNPRRILYSSAGIIFSSSYGGKELQAYLKESYDKKSDVVVVKDTLESNPVLGWCILSIILNKLDEYLTEPHANSEIRGIKDLNYLPVILQENGKIDFDGDGSPEIVTLAELSPQETRNLLVILNSERFSGRISESKRVEMERREGEIKNNAVPVKVIYDQLGKPSFFIYTLNSSFFAKISHT
jgi:4-amino-4-deoxy-L-arabinose transferase-like glycosyltransferase